MQNLQRLYRDELEFLRLQGKEFSHRHPQLTRFLAEKSSDPDVERLLEGFAFLSARLREKIEDDLPELTHSLINLLWPNYLRPVPSTTMIKFRPKKSGIDGPQLIEKNTTLQSEDINLSSSNGGKKDDGKAVSCLFRSTHDVMVYPMDIAGVEEYHSREKAIISIDLKTVNDAAMHTTGCNTLDFFLSGDAHTALTLYLWFFRYLDKIEVTVDGRTNTLSGNVIERLGFSPDDALLPYPRNVFDGYRIIQEFLSFPQQFYSFRLKNLIGLWGDELVPEARIAFHFSRAMPDGIKVRMQDFSLYCVPAVNLFEYHAEPLLFDGSRVNYPVIPSGNEEDVYNVFSVQGVSSVKASDAANTGVQSDVTKHYVPFESFQHEVERQHGRHTLYYRVAMSNSIKDDAIRHNIAFVRSDESECVANNETVSIDLLCTNGDLPEMLGIGDICKPTQDTPPFVDFSNITRPTASHPPVLDGALHWSLISNLALNYLSMLDIEPLRTILRAYDFAALHDVQAERQSQKRLAALKSIDTQPIDRLIYGFPTRGLESTFKIDQEGFLCEGEVYLFGTVLSKFFSLYSSINSFHHLRMENLNNNEVYEWPLEQGKQPVI